MTKNWEYKVVPWLGGSFAAMQAVLNAEGRHGWEVVWVGKGDLYLFFILKREAPTDESGLPIAG